MDMEKANDELQKVVENQQKDFAQLKEGQEPFNRSYKGNKAFIFQAPPNITNNSIITTE